MKASDKMDAICAELGQQLGSAMRRNAKISLVYGVTESVDEDARTVNAVVDDDKVFRDIPLDVVPRGGNSVFLLPAVGSAIILGFIEGQPESAFVIQTTTLDKIVISVGETNVEVTDGFIQVNGGENNGLVLIDALTQKLNALVDTFNAHTHPVSTTGTAAAQTGTAAATTSQAQEFNASDYENTAIKQ